MPTVLGRGRPKAAQGCVESQCIVFFPYKHKSATSPTKVGNLQHLKQKTGEKNGKAGVDPCNGIACWTALGTLNIASGTDLPKALFMQAKYESK